MPELLPALEAQRASFQHQLSQLGDMRAGSITTTGGRCGNSHCHCHHKDDAGHGPFFRLTRKIAGKTVTETFVTPVALRKAQNEIAEYHRFRELSHKLVEVNEKICRARPAEDALTPQEKKAVAIHAEIARELTSLLRLIFAERKQAGSMDLEAVEMAFRTALHQAGAAALTQLLQFPEPATEQQAIPCPCGNQARYRELRSRRILTVWGEVELSRPWYLCPHCHNGQFPVDRQLDIENRDCSPGVRRMQALVGQQAPFDHGREQMKLLASLEVTAKSVERTAEAIGADIAAGDQREIGKAVQLDLPTIVGQPIPILYVQMDGTGVPVVKKETEGRKGKSDGQPAHTREVKLGCVFTQTTWDKDGFAVRDPDSTTYTGAIESAEDFGKRIYLEAWNRGWGRAAKKVVMGDGAEWIWNQADLHFPCAVQIVDLYHARQHLWDLARRLFPNHSINQKSWIKVHQKRLLDKGKIEKLVLSLRSIQSNHAELLEQIRIEADYFERNAERMRYPKFRRQHLFVGSGVIEAGCKTVIGSRLKQSGMFWTVRGANSIIALRCCHLVQRILRSD